MDNVEISQIKEEEKHRNMGGNQKVQKVFFRMI